MIKSKCAAFGGILAFLAGCGAGNGGAELEQVGVTADALSQPAALVYKPAPMTCQITPNYTSVDFSPPTVKFEEWAVSPGLGYGIDLTKFVPTCYHYTPSIRVTYQVLRNGAPFESQSTVVDCEDTGQSLCSSTCNGAGFVNGSVPPGDYTLHMTVYNTFEASLPGGGKFMDCTTTAPLHLPGSWWYDAGYASLPRDFVDVNADGKADYCRFAGNNGVPYVSCGLTTPTGSLVSGAPDATGFGPAWGFNGGLGIDVGYSDRPRGFVDVNGDGRADYCRMIGATDNLTIACMTAGTGGFDANQYGVTSSDHFDAGYSNMPRGFYDANGDGKVDYCRFIGAGSTLTLSCGRSNGVTIGNWDYNSAPGFDVGYGDRPRKLLDINGDGFLDYCRFIGDSNAPLASCTLGSATGFGPNTSYNKVDAGYGDRPRDFYAATPSSPGGYCAFVGSSSSPTLSCVPFVGSGFGVAPPSAAIDAGFSALPRAFVQAEGNGTPEYCRFVGSSSAPKLTCTRSSAGSIINTGLTSTAAVDAGFSDSPRRFVDMNGDGFADYCRFRGDANHGNYLACALGGSYHFDTELRSPVLQ